MSLMSNVKSSLRSPEVSKRSLPASVSLPAPPLIESSPSAWFTACASEMRDRPFIPKETVLRTVRQQSRQ